MTKYYLKITKNPSSYSICGYAGKVLCWCENETKLESVLGYGLSESELPKRDYEYKLYEVTGDKIND